MAVRASKLLLPVFEREGGRKGRLSIQTNPKFFRDPARVGEQAIHFAGLAPNMQVKMPATRAGVQAAEEVTAAGASINATVCFTVPQALAMAEAVERGLARREAAGEDVSRMSPVITIMVGRLDDWMGVLVARNGLMVNPGVVHRAGIAAFKRAYGLFGERGYRARLLAAAYRHHMHWSELIGGGHRPNDPQRMAEKVQCLGHPSRGPDRRSRAAGRAARAAAAIPGLPPSVRAERHERR
jgi:transaldolase